MGARLGWSALEVCPGRSTRPRPRCVDLLHVDGAALSVVTDHCAQGTYGSSSELSRRLDELQFTFGEGPCMDSVRLARPVLCSDLDSPLETRWPVFTGAVLGEGVRAVFALPVAIATSCVAALDLFRSTPGPLSDDALTGGLLREREVSRAFVTLRASRRAGTGGGSVEPAQHVGDAGTRHSGAVEPALREVATGGGEVVQHL